MNFSLENKTIRPGNLRNFNYYHSDRHAPNQVENQPKQFKPRHTIVLLASISLTLLVLGGIFVSHYSNKSNRSQNQNNFAVTGSTSSNNKCRANTLSQNIIVNISERKTWACQFQKLLYSSPVVTGISTHPDTNTPSGSYTILSKSTNLTLSGSDSTGSWSDPVNYWMPFLNNQFGSYGFHDATWRGNNEFGNVSPNANNASHGCVELPLTSAKWFYGWANIGTSVTITD
ncbi:MAG TPA: L,D-transpeptidase [Patescibacteria group bacterium]|nr:L,D-transpeptidase [Patescibacteria group bacterium]